MKKDHIAGRSLVKIYVRKKIYK